MRVPKWVIAVLVVPAAMASLALTGSKSVQDLPSYAYTAWWPSSLVIATR